MWSPSTFLHYAAILFHSQNSIFHRTKDFNSDEVQLVHCSCIDHLFGVISKNSLPNHRSQRFSPTLSSTSFIALHLQLLYILSKFCMSVEFRSKFIYFFFAFRISISIPFIEKTLLDCLSTFTKKKSALFFCWVYFQTLYSAALNYESILLPT